MKKHVFTSLFFLIISLVFTGTVTSNSTPKVFLLDSNRSIEKFSEVEKSFKENFPGKVQSIGLKKLGKRRVNLKNLIAPGKNDLIYCIGSSALSIALKNFPKNRIIFSSVINWRLFNLTDQTYSVAAQVPIETQITLFKFIFPSISRIGIVYSPKYNQAWFEEAEEIAQEFGLHLIGLPYKEKTSVNKLFDKLFPIVDAIWLIPDPAVITRDSFFEIIRKSTDSKKPILTYSESFVENGASLAISVDNKTTGRQAALLAKRLINNETIETRAQMPAGSSISMNMKKVKEIGLKLNTDALGNINRIIE